MSVLIVEDDITFSLMLQTWLKKKGFTVVSASNLSDAKIIAKKETISLILLDLRLPDGDGIDFLKWMQENSLFIPTIVMTGYAEIQTAVLAIKAGASDYVSKPINPQDLLKKIEEITKKETETAKPSATPAAKESNTYIEGNSHVAQQMYEHVRLVATTDMSVLIVGDSGTGKEYVARRIHEQSQRANAPFVAVDCGAIPKDLAASEFFGHMKGSFTGAVENKTGAFVAADGGTIFLDEIGNLTYDTQVQLLRALQERKIKPIGTNQEIPVNVRFISATNENLRQAIDNGDFREDLYHRINEFMITVPSIREREGDLMLFANHFLAQANKQLQKDIAGFDDETIALFNNYQWPGNIRQMKNVIKYATLLATGSYITLKELPSELLNSAKELGQSTTPTTLKDEEHERATILRALNETGNNKSQAAKLLGIDRKTLYNKLKLYMSTKKD
jgi:Response regulator containing CheY-like receiver, AAA-type ATPase, and DNA-binding domains